MEIFKNGSKFIRFDCHLHTVADKEFKYEGEDNQFINDFVDKLDNEGISVGIITTHNKFDYNQYRAIKREANKKDIFIILYL